MVTPAGWKFAYSLKRIHFCMRRGMTVAAAVCAAQVFAFDESDKPNQGYWLGGFGPSDFAKLDKGLCATVWFDDYEETRPMENKPHDIGLQFQSADPATKGRTYDIRVRRYSTLWRTEIMPGVKGELQWDGKVGVQMAGWNRFDLVMPPQDGKGGRARLFLNGKLLYEPPVAAGRLLVFGTGHFTNHVARGVVFNPAAFRPNPVAAIMPEREFKHIVLEKGRDFAFTVSLDERGAGAKTGELEVLLLDGRGTAVDSVREQVRWPRKDVNVVFSKVPRSGEYTIETRYTFDGLPHPDRLRRGVDITFVDSGATDTELRPIVLTGRDWDLLGAMPLKPAERSYFEWKWENAEFEIPETLPTDWSGAEKWHGAWMYGTPHDNPGRNWASAWYRQILDVPSVWKNCRIRLSATDPATRATAWVNGRKFDTQDWPYAEWDVTDALRLGASNEVVIHVSGDPCFGAGRLVRELLGPTCGEFWSPRMRGLVGDVVLAPEPEGARIDGVALRPHVKPDVLEAVFELKGLKPGERYRVGGEVRVKGEMKLALPEREFVAKATDTALAVSASFPGVRYWDIHSPWLYDFTAHLSEKRSAGWKTVSAPWPERFGFRELDWHGPSLKLNGRVFTHCLGLDAPAVTPDLVLQADARNLTSYYEMAGQRHAQMFDEAGLSGDGRTLLWGWPGGHLFGMLAAADKADDPRYWKLLEKYFRDMARIYRNHPSVFSIRGFLGANTAGQGSMYNPLFQNGTWYSRFNEIPTRVKMFKLADRMRELCRSYDPTRYISDQDSGSVNDCCHITEYVGWTPLQEQIEKGLFWSKVAVKPFFISEQAAPYYCNWTDGCAQGCWCGIPKHQEWSAALVGDRAWDLSAHPWYTNNFADVERQLDLRRAEALKPCRTDAERRDAKLKVRMQSTIPMIQLCWKTCEGPLPLHVELTRYLTVQQALWNRWHGIGMICPEFTGQFSTTEMSHECYAPVTGALAGPAESVTDRTHVFRAGETLRRGVILLNNSHEDRMIEFDWSLTLGGLRIGGEKKQVRIPAGGKTHEPISASLAVSGKGELRVAFSTDGRFIRKDSCDIEVVKPVTVDLKGVKVALVDPGMQTMREFDRLGIPYHFTAFNEDLDRYDLVVFGKRAFNYETRLLPDGLDLGALVRAGKRIVIFEQDEAVLRERFRFRTEYLSARAVFSRGNFAIDDDLLHDWRGEATLTDGYEVARNGTTPAYYQAYGSNDGGEWQYLWNDGLVHPRPMKWGNRHIVSTVTVIKPDTGNFRTLVDCGYAQDYAAAFEYVKGDGRIVFCQLDVSGRTLADPVADAMIVRLLAHARAPRDLPDAPVRVVDARGSSEQVLRAKDEIAAFAEKGGTVFVKRLPKTTLDCGWLPFKVEVKEETLRQVMIGKPSDPLLAGLGNSDFFFKCPLKLVTVNGRLVTEVRHGKGRYVFCQIDPEDFGDTEVDHWFKEPMRRTERLVRTLLTNVGAPEERRPMFLDRPGASTLPVGRVDLAGKWSAAETSKRYTAIRAELKKKSPASADWREVRLPAVAQTAYPDWKSDGGEMWLRRTFELKNVSAGATGALLIGNISGENTVFVNGAFVGVTDTETDVNAVASLSRRYAIPEGVLKKGANEISIRVTWNARAELGLKGSHGGFAGEMALEVTEPRSKSAIPGAIDLSSRSEWWGMALEKIDSPYDNGCRRRFSLPAAVQDQYADLSGRNGAYWFRREINVTDEIPETCRPAIILGAVDDEDWVYVNGTLVGHTGKDTNPDNYWAAPRNYVFDANLLKPGRNVIDIRLNDLTVGASVTGPMKLVFEPPEVTAARTLAERPYLHDVGRPDDPYWHHGF